MAYQTRDSRSARAPLLDRQTQAALERRGQELLGLGLLALAALAWAMLWSYSPDDPNWLLASDAPVTNWLGSFGASVAHPLMMIVGRAAWGLPLVLGAWGLRMVAHRAGETARAVFAPIFVAALAAALAALTPPEGWAQASGQGGLLGDTALGIVLTVLPFGTSLAALLLMGLALGLGAVATGVTWAETRAARAALQRALVLGYAWALRTLARALLLSLDGLQAGRARLADAREDWAERRAAAREAAREAAEAQAALEAEHARAAAEAEAAALPAAGTRLMPGAPAAAPPRAAAPRAAIVRPQPAARAMPPALSPFPDGPEAWRDAEVLPEPDFGSALAPAPLPAAFAPRAAEPEEPAPLAAPPREPSAPERQTFIAALIRRARGLPEPGTAEAALTDADRIQAAISGAIRARAQGAPGRPAPAAPRIEPPLAARLMPQRRPLLAEPPVAAPLGAPAAAAGPGAPLLPPPVEPPAPLPPEALPARLMTRLRARAEAASGPPSEAVPALAPFAGAALPGEAPADALDDLLGEGWAEPAPAVPAVDPARPATPVAPPPAAAPAPRAAAPRPAAPARPARAVPDYAAPPLDLLSDPASVQRHHLSDAALEQNARDLEQVLDDFGVKGEITHVRPGPVVTMYELEPAPGVKASRVIGLADDIARNMSALSARVSTVPGRNVIGIELPNDKREKVVLREIITAREFGDSQMRLPLALGKDIGGEPVVANLAKMPHLLIAGTTGSGKSVAINTMILSLLYKLTPEECRLIMIDPKMLELSVYDGIPHLLSPVVTDPRKAVVALKWVVGEMEERYRRMSKMGVRNLDGYNGRVREALANGEMFSRTVQTGFDEETGDPVFETDEFMPEVIPYIVVIVDEMADLMMTAGKEIEACIQRLAQMARASGIHLIMATQRPSVDVITGIIKANFPTRISFQVTSKIDSRTILGEQGAEQLLGQGDMLYMAGGGRTIRVHGPFCSDEEVEEIVTYLKGFGPPSYVGAVLEEVVDDGDSGDAAAPTGSETEDALYDMAVQIVAKDRKCSTSYIQRKLAIGYNKAARLVEQMEREGVVTPANHVGKREILVPEVH